MIWEFDRKVLELQREILEPRRDWAEFKNGRAEFHWRVLELPGNFFELGQKVLEFDREVWELRPEFFELGQKVLEFEQVPARGRQRFSGGCFSLMTLRGVLPWDAGGSVRRPPHGAKDRSELSILPSNLRKVY